MRITKPRNWHLYSKEMKRIWWLEDYPKLIKEANDAAKQFNDFIEEIKDKKSKTIIKNEIPF